MTNEEFDERMSDLMDMVDNGVKTEKEIVDLAVSQLNADPQKVVDWIDDYHMDAD